MLGGASFQILNNAIDTESYTYDLHKRDVMRSRFGMNDKFVVGHVGRFSYPKNHRFLIDIFAAVHAVDPAARLLLVGTGDLEGQIHQKVSRLGLDEAVQFLGVRSDVDRILQAVDVFLLPSLYEGLGMAAVEAQAAGLPCIVSDEVPRLCDMTGHVFFLPLDARPEQWAEEVLKAVRLPRESQKEKIAAAGFDIQTTAKWLSDFYFEMW